jgi:hypothetical protein
MEGETGGLNAFRGLILPSPYPEFHGQKGQAGHRHPLRETGWNRDRFTAEEPQEEKKRCMDQEREQEKPDQPSGEILSRPMSPPYSHP